MKLQKDICGSQNLASQDVLFTKPWQREDGYRYRNRSRSDSKRRERSRFWDRGFQNNYERRSRGFQRDDRSTSREGRRTVSFSEKKRDLTPGEVDSYFTFEEELFVVNHEYDSVFISDCLNRSGTQLMILDIGCPKSLMGTSELKKLIGTFSEEEKKYIQKYSCRKKFKFGS